MKFAKIIILTATVVLLAGLTQAPAQANVVGNPGFEDPITFDGPPFVGSWEGFNGDGASAGNSNLMPRSGAQHLQATIDNTINTFAGAFQDVPNLTAGQEVTFSGWHMTPSNPLDVGIEIRIEWRDSVADIEISRTDNLSPTVTGDYERFDIVATVPVGADTARLVYAIQSFSTAPNGNGSVYLDDVSFPSEEPVATQGTAWGNLKSLYR